MGGKQSSSSKSRGASQSQGPINPESRRTSLDNRISLGSSVSKGTARRLEAEEEEVEDQKVLRERAPSNSSLMSEAIPASNSNISGILQVEPKIVKGSFVVEGDDVKESSEIRSSSDPYAQFSHHFEGVGFFELHRGGYIVRTRAVGPIQFGIPPETIKDSLARGMPVPKHFVIQGEMFDRKVGLSKAEFEFPIYYQYFVNRSRVNIVTTKELQRRIRLALKETLLGPGTDCNVMEDYPANTPADALPNFAEEANSLDPDRETTGIDAVVTFTYFDEITKEAQIVAGDGTIVTIRAFAAEDRIKGGTKPMFEVKEGEQVIAHVPASVKLHPAGSHINPSERESVRSKHQLKQLQKKTYEEEERQHMEARSSSLAQFDPSRRRGSNLESKTTESKSGVLDVKTIEIGVGQNSSEGAAVGLSSSQSISPTPMLLGGSVSQVSSTLEPDLTMHRTQDVLAYRHSPFDIPMFGVTMLGASHGFDASGRTTGFVLWMNRRGLMVDPPPDSFQILESSGVPPLAIEGIILTHTHADHDAGTFQRILRTRQMRLFTTRTVERSFINKYSAITGFDGTFLRSLFHFTPVQCGDTGIKILGGEIKFHYSLHTIPCIGLEAYYEDHSICYSADTRFDPDLTLQLYKDGKIGKRRYEQLSNFPYNHTIILHELGVPPIHTPKEALKKAAFDEKYYRSGKPLSDRLFVVHSSKGSADGFANSCSDWDTIRITVDQARSKQISEITSVLSNVEWLQLVGREGLSKLAKTCKYSSFKENQIIANLKEGESSQCFWVVMLGIVGVSEGTDGNEEHKGIGESFGQHGLLNQLESNGNMEERSALKRIPGVPLSIEIIQASRDAIKKGVSSVFQDNGESSMGANSENSVNTLRKKGNKAQKAATSAALTSDFPALVIRALREPCVVIEIKNKNVIKLISKNKAKGKEVTESLRRFQGWPQDGRYNALSRNAPLTKLLRSQLAVRQFLENLSEDYVTYPDGYVLEDGRGAWNPTSAYFVKEGVLRVTPIHAAFSFRNTGESKLPGHNESIRSFECARGSLLGDFNALIKREKSPYRIVCVEECELYHIELKQLLKFFEEFPGIKFQCIDRILIGWMLDCKSSHLEDITFDAFGGIVVTNDKNF